jgi:hypothetical protein
LGDSDGLRPALNAWFTDTLAPELKEAALPAENVENDVRFEREAWKALGEDAFTVTQKQLDEMFKSRAEFEAGVKAEAEREAMRGENDPAGWTGAGSGVVTPENALFVLSLSEVNKYRELGTLNLKSMASAHQTDRDDPFIPQHWWLRSPGSGNCCCSIAIVSVCSSTKAPGLTAGSATSEYGFRPALWIKGWGVTY